MQDIKCLLSKTWLPSRSSGKDSRNTMFFDMPIHITTIITGTKTMMAKLTAYEKLITVTCVLLIDLKREIYSGGMHPTKTVKTGLQWKTDKSLAEGTVGHVTRRSSMEQLNACYMEDTFWWHGKGKVHPRTGHKGPEGGQRYSSTLSLASALDGVGGQCHTLAALLLGKEAGWATGPVWTVAENLTSTRIWSPDRPACSE